MIKRLRNSRAETDDLAENKLTKTLIAKVIFMRQRIISAGVGIAILFVVMFFYTGIVLNIVIGLVAALGVYEILKAVKHTINHRLLSGTAILFAFLVPFLITFLIDQAKTSTHLAIFAVYAFVLCCILLIQHDRLSINQVGMVFMMSVIIPEALGCLVRMRDIYDQRHIGFFYILIALASAWIADAGAYFAGSIFGKTKLAPKISPKKTVEGLIGGVIVNVIVLVLLAFGYEQISHAIGGAVKINYIALMIIGIPSALIGTVGDLTFSLIKRQNGIKDFGTLMPGHGGILDRFDSAIFTVPFFYLVLNFVDVVTVL